MKNSISFSFRKFLHGIIFIFLTSLLPIFSQTYAAEPRPSLSGLQSQLNALQVEVRLNKRVIGLDTGWKYYEGGWEDISFPTGYGGSCSPVYGYSRCIVHLQFEGSSGVVGGEILGVDGGGNICAPNWIMNYNGTRIVIDSSCKAYNNRFRIIVELLPLDQI